MERAKVFREALGFVVHTATSVLALCSGVALIADHHVLLGAVCAAIGVVDARFASCRVVVRREQLVLHRFGASRTIPIGEIDWIDPALRGTWMRAPRLVLHSGEVVRLDSFKVPTLMVSKSTAALKLAQHLSVPVPITPVSPAGWFADPLGGGLRSWDGDAWTRVTLEDVGAEDDPAAGVGASALADAGGTSSDSEQSA